MQVISQFFLYARTVHVSTQFRFCYSESITQCCARSFSHLFGVAGLSPVKNKQRPPWKVVHFLLEAFTGLPLSDEVSRKREIQTMTHRTDTNGSRFPETFFLLLFVSSSISSHRHLSCFWVIDSDFGSASQVLWPFACGLWDCTSWRYILDFVLW